MAFADFQAKQQQNKQKAVLRDYFVKRSGQLLCLSDDPTFVNLLRLTVKELAVNQPELIVLIPDASRALKAISDSFAADKKPALFIERVMGTTGETSFLVKQFRESFPELRIFVMTTTAEKGRIMLLYESGADNFVLKPISSIDLIEKMSATLRQPSVIRQLLDKARTLIVKNVSKEAIKITQKVLEVKPDNASGYVVMGDALRVSGMADKAQVAYERACKYSEDYLEPLQKLVDLARETGKPDMQLEYLKRLDTLSPLNAQRKVEMGELQVTLGNTEAAKQLFDTAVHRAYKDAMAQVAAMTEKIAVSLQEADPVQAEKYLRRCLELKGNDLTVDDLSTFNQLGISLRKQDGGRTPLSNTKRRSKSLHRRKCSFTTSPWPMPRAKSTTRPYAPCSRRFPSTPACRAVPPASRTIWGAFSRSVTPGTRRCNVWKSLWNFSRIMKRPAPCWIECAKRTKRNSKSFGKFSLVRRRCLE